MAVVPNGELEKSSASKLDGKSSRPSPRVKRPAKGYSSWILSSLSRLAIWYILITCLLRCPSTPEGLTANSPRICKPYMSTKETLSPVLRPYYDTYAASYIERVRPYAQQLNQTVLAPASKIVEQSYNQHAAPRVEQGKTFAFQQWEATVLPQWQAAQNRAKHVYVSSLEPHVNKAASVVLPHYRNTQSRAQGMHQQYILPSMEKSKPYLEKAYGVSHDFMLHKTLPSAQWAWSSVFAFIDGTLWPQMRALYGDNVRPQLVMISDRIAKYQQGRKLKAKTDKMDTSISKPAMQVATDKPAVPNSEVTSDTSDIPDKAKPATTSLTGKEQIEAARPQISSDLRTWQEKFSAAADKGAEDLQDRVRDLINGLVDKEVNGVGLGLLKALNMTVETEVAAYQSRIIDAVASLPDESSPSLEKSAEDDLQQAIRVCASPIRDRATAVRQWHSKVVPELARRAENAAESTLDVLDGIRDLGLQEIGMRWAWMDGVTYKDWAKYHEMKKEFENWRDEVRNVATKHQALQVATTACDDLLENAMDTASAAANELVRMKDAVRWKIRQRDSTNNFESRPLDDAAAAASPETFNLAQNDAQDVAEGVQSMSAFAVVGETDPTLGHTEKPFSAAKDPEQVAFGESPDQAKLPHDSSSATMGADSHQLEDVDDHTARSSSARSETLGSAASEAGEYVEAEPETMAPGSSSLFPGAIAQQVNGRGPVLEDFVEESEGTSYSESAQGLFDDAAAGYADVTKAVSEAMIGTSQGTVESVHSVADDQYSRALAAASSALYGTSQGAAESVTSLAAGKYQQAVLAASSAIYGTPIPASQSVVSQAKSAYTDAVNLASDQYEQARSIVSAQISGTSKPIHEEMFSSVESAYSGSLATASGKLDSALDAAARQYSSLTKSLGAVLSQPTPEAMESIVSLASSNLQVALGLASTQYASAKEVMGATPTPAGGQYVMEAQQAYYAAMGLAHERYSEFIQAASTAAYGTPTPVLNKLSDAALQAASGASTPVLSSMSTAASEAMRSSSDAYRSAMLAASAQFAAATEAAAAGRDLVVSGNKKKSDTSPQSVIDGASEQYKLALSAASSSLSIAVESASVRAYGSSTGAIESVASQASENWEALVSKASEQVYGAPTPFFASLTSRAAEYPSQATSAMGAQYAEMQAFVSELVAGREPDFTDSVMSRLSSAYNTGYHVSMASSALSIGDDAYSTASSVASSVSSAASSVVSSQFTPPPQIDFILGSASDQVDAAIEAVSAQLYGSTTGVYEQARSAAEEAYSSAVSVASEKVHGSPTGYAEAAQDSISDAISSAQQALSEAIYGTPTGKFQSAYSSLSSGMSDQVTAAGSAAGDGYSSVVAQVSGAAYGPELGALESAQSRLAAVFESAEVRVAELAASAGTGASEAISVAQSNVEQIASQASSVASSFTDRAKDEL